MRYITLGKIKYFIVMLLFIFINIWWFFLSPWGRRKPMTDKEIYETAIEYDLEHGTDSHKEFPFDSNWYSERIGEK